MASIKLLNLVTQIKVILELDRQKEYPDWYMLQEIMIGNTNWNNQKENNPQWQQWEYIMALNFLNGLENEDKDTILKLLAIFINFFQMFYQDDKLPDNYNLIERYYQYQKRGETDD